jgi:hypothetical protein
MKTRPWGDDPEEWWFRVELHAGEIAVPVKTAQELVPPHAQPIIHSLQGS